MSLVQCTDKYERGTLTPHDVIDNRTEKLVEHNGYGPAAEATAANIGQTAALLDQTDSAEREHTLSLTRAQRYVRRELQVLFKAVQDEDMRQQIAVLEAAFRRPNPRPAVRNELNRIRREGITGEVAFW